MTLDSPARRRRAVDIDLAPLRDDEFDLGQVCVVIDGSAAEHSVHV
jgi:hypothetical protein